MCYNSYLRPRDGVNMSPKWDKVNPRQKIRTVRRVSSQGEQGRTDPASALDLHEYEKGDSYQRQHPEDEGS